MQLFLFSVKVSHIMTRGEAAVIMSHCACVDVNKAAQPDIMMCF